MQLPQSRSEAHAALDFRSYNELQVREIQRHKWIESEKAGRDLGDEAIHDWIQRYAASFREAHHERLPGETRGSWVLKLKERFVTVFR